MPKRSPKAPKVTYTTYREFARSGSRVEDGVRRSRRVNLTTAVLCQLFDPRESTLDSVHDYLWSACEESTWIASAHEAIGMDLFETQSAFTLAECLRVLGRQVAPEVRERVEYEIRRRVIDPFLERVGRPVRPWPDQESLSLTRHFIDPGRTRIGFKRIMNNWIGVCYGAVGAVLIYMEENQARLGRGLSGVVKGLYEFLDVAFLDDGASTEGTGYWQFGLSNFVAFSELLRNRTGGRIDLLAHPKMRAVAEFPLKTRLSPGRHYSHADCSPRVSLMPGMASKLAERTGVKELLGLIPADTPQSWNMSMALRDLLWWNGRKGPEPRVTDSLLECAGMFRLVSGPVVIAGKAGHNAEHHNHNDVGSFVVHSRGEDLLSRRAALRQVVLSRQALCGLRPGHVTGPQRAGGRRRAPGSRAEVPGHRHEFRRVGHGEVGRDGVRSRLSRAVPQIAQAQAGAPPRGRLRG